MQKVNWLKGCKVSVLLIMAGMVIIPSLYADVRGQNIEDYATIEAFENNIPIYAFGFTYVYGECPDFLPGTTIQTGNHNSKTKIKPKKSWELKENKIGSTPAGVPRTADNDDQPLRSIHLIDGDVSTCWSSRGQSQPDVEAVWIRVDLAREEKINAVNLIPHATGLMEPEEDSDRVNIGQSFPEELTIKVSCDALHWNTVYENKNMKTRRSEPLKLGFLPVSAKQVMIIGRKVPQIVVEGVGHCFSFAELEIKNVQGSNRALASKGGSITVSSTNLGYRTDRFTQEMLWPIQFDLGFKWARVGYDRDVFTWAHVEREKGILKVDPRADEIITEAEKNGISIVLCLDHGNWLYAKNPKILERTRDLWFDANYNMPPGEEAVVEDENYFKGYLNYVRFMVNHFKDRVTYFEVWNEWGAGTEVYCKLFEPAVKVIREEFPEAQIVIASPTPEETPHFVYGVLDISGPIFDVVGFHPWYNADPTSKEFLEYPEFLKEFKRECTSKGFKGKYMATEYTWAAPYPLPPFDSEAGDIPDFKITEIHKAKYAARLTIIHNVLDVYSYWNELFQQQMTEWGIGLLRNGFSSSPITPTQPEPTYYVMRTLSTVLDEAEEEDIKIQYSKEDEMIEWYTMSKPDGEKMLAVWLKGFAKDDDSQILESDIVFTGLQLKKVKAIDILNGEVQKLDVNYNGNDTVLKGIHIKDWPIIISGNELQIAGSESKRNWHEPI